jgi:hypothetical protein
VVAFVIRLMTVTEKGEFNVVRYDTAHGTPHRDVLSTTHRVIQKDWLTDLDFQAAMEYGIQDFKNNHENYLEHWKSHTR